MSSRTARTLVAEAFGQEARIRTSGGYTVAGVILNFRPDAEPELGIVARGWSDDSVKARTRRVLRIRRPDITPRNESWVMEVVSLNEETAPVIYGYHYFKTHNLRVTAIFKDGKWEGGYRMSAGRSMIRKLAREGVTGIVVTGNGHDVDFEMPELLASMNKRAAR